ncbi:hypothetical protein BN8_06083 [Fibrisoma limi BUZ 3]|uniref:AlgX/AlgJ SGNH hydrolase-like domain-containing protein n=1 Tax=Fibrisoma limi BUZ 3 TaxID=1185876 RepID=I2GS22_9BACT|nr:hypothetical protein [Fibrisoma limi]CCH56700.1 hypothetical protein BN8_06083 [Fibrisoma limi BUZ 3]
MAAAPTQYEEQTPVTLSAVQKGRGINRSIRTWLLAFGFGLLLALPTAERWMGLTANFQSTENRRLTPFPTFHYPHILTFIHELDQYCKESFGFRNALFYEYSTWKYDVLHTSPLPEKVVIGKGGWLFVGNSYNRVIDQHRGFVNLSDDALQQIEQKLLARQQELKRLGIRFYVLIAPDSHTIYPEYLPDELRSGVQDPSSLDRLTTRIRQHGTLPLIDLRDTLMQAKKQYQVYYQTDTHWNEPGALIGCVSLVDRMRRDVPSIPKPSAYHIHRQAGGYGDLALMLALQSRLHDTFKYTVEVTPDRKAQRLAEYDMPGHYLPSGRYAGPDQEAPRLLLFGDSFSHNLIKFLPGYFSQTYHVYQTTFDAELVNAEKPDIVVLEIVERDLEKLALF